MSYSIWDYIAPTVGIFAVVSLLQLGSCAYFAVAKKKAQNNHRLIYVPYIFTLLMLITLMPVLSSAHYVGPLLGPERATATGIVENIQSGTISLYWDRSNSRLTSPSFISVSGTKYYILSDSGLSVGDHVALEYCPEGNAILEWKMLTAGTLHEQQPPPEPTTPAQQEHITESIEPALTVEWMIILFCFTLLVLLAFREPLTIKRREYIHRNDFYAEELVCPRKISIANCALEFIATAFFLLSFLAHSIAFTIFLAAIVSCLWLMRIFTQKTMIQYNGNQFIYMTVLTSKRYTLSSVVDVQLSQTKQTGFMQLKIRLTDGNRIFLEELNYSGVYEFYDWLTKTKSGANKTGNKAGDGSLS